MCECVIVVRKKVCSSYWNVRRLEVSCPRPLQIECLSDALSSEVSDKVIRADEIIFEEMRNVSSLDRMERKTNFINLKIRTVQDWLWQANAHTGL